MQRHRHDHIAFGDQLCAGARQPARETGYQLQPVGMLERQDRATAVVVIGQYGAGLVESRRLGQAGGAEIFAFQRHRKWQAAAVAAGTVQKGKTAPADGAKAGIRGRCAATNAQRRKQQIQHGFGGGDGHGLV